ncbi:hypothetical protein [Anaerorhabdus furcosa]|uniref:Uncharacterized protein n=1 Tax=Anaerorhabdus furcosa TaxID=118967 RepID=A0A1T4PIX7_9FIRM|nr:hypothetical protein [Anaerorhabdus furcosa]SJZ91493.1 hypothetical protein SAMN02745191_2060 [Anaerorhabdus furcosa]
MAKFNFLDAFKKQEETKPSDIQIEIEEREKSIEQLEKKLEHSGVLLGNEEKTQNIEYSAKKKQVEVAKKEATQLMDEIEDKSEKLQNSMKELSNKSEKAAKDVNKKKAALLADASKKSNALKSQIAKKEKEIEEEIKGIKQSQDKLFIKERNRLIQETEALKESLSSVAAIESEKQKKELKKMESQIEKMKKSFDKEIIDLENKLSEALKNEEITLESYNQAIQNIKDSRKAEIDNRKVELQAKVSQWAASYNEFAQNNRVFLDAKKAELELLKQHESSLKDLLKQKQDKIDIEKNNLIQEYASKVKELEVNHNHLQNTLAGSKQQYRSLSDMYKQEVDNFASLRDAEQRQIQELIEQLGKEYEQFQQEIVEKTNGLDVKLKAEADSIYNFYRDLLASEEEKLNSNINFVKEEIRREEDKLSLTRKEYEEKKNTIENIHYQKLNDIKERILQCQTNIKNAEIEHHQYLAELNAQFEKENVVLQEQLKTQENEFAKKRNELDLNVEAFIKQLEDKKDQVALIQRSNNEEVLHLDNQIKELKNDHTIAIQEKQKLINDLQNELEHVNDKIQSVHEIREAERNKHEEKLREFELKREELTNAHYERVNEIKDKFQEKIELFEQQVLAKKEEMQAKYDESILKLQKDHEARVDEFKSKSAQFTQDLNKEIKATKSKIEAMEAEFENKMLQENGVLQDTTSSFNELKQSNATEIETIKRNHHEQLTKLKEVTQNSIDEIVRNIGEYTLNTNNHITNIRDEIAHLTDEEKNLVLQMSLLQEDFNARKNSLIELNSNQLQEHLQSINNFEQEIDQKRQEIRNAEESLTDLINQYKLIQDDENQKVSKLKNILANELDEQKREIENSISQLEVQKEERIDLLRAEYDLTRKTISNKLNSELVDIQHNIEDEKNRILQEQGELEASYANKLETNNQILNRIREQVKVLSVEFEKAEENHKNEISLLREDFEHRKAQLEYEAEIARESNLKQFNDLKADLDSKLNQVQIEKIQLKNSVDAKIKQQQAKKETIESFILDYERNNKIHEEDRQREIENYQAMVERLNANIDELNSDYENTKQSNQLKVEELLQMQKNVEEEINQIMATRGENYQKAIDQVTQEHENRIQEFINEEDAKQKELNSQNEEILNNFLTNFEEYKVHLDEQLSIKRSEITEFIRLEDEKLENEKTKFESIMLAMEKEEETRIEERNAEKENFKKYWDDSLDTIRKRIKDATDKMLEQEKEIRNHYNPQIEQLSFENEELKNQEVQISQAIHELEEKFEQRKFENDQKRRQYEEECTQNIANIERLIKDRQEQINSIKQAMDNEANRFVQIRQQEEDKLKTSLQSKEAILQDERAKVNEIIDKQQKIFDKLAAKKMAAIEDENRRNNKILEKELRRVEKEKAFAGENFELTMDELDQLIREKEKRYESLLNEQIAKNDAYIQEYKETVRKRQAIDERNDSVELETVAHLRDQLLENEKIAQDELQENLDETKSKYLQDIYSLQEKNGQILKEITGLRREYESLNATYRSNDDTISFKDVFDAFEDKLNMRKNRLNELEKEEQELRQEKANQHVEQSDVYDQMIQKHRQALAHIDQEIENEQNRLVEFEGQMSERRRLQKEMEIDNKNLFAKKLNYLKEKMLDN